MWCDELSIESRNDRVVDQTFQIGMPEVTHPDPYLHPWGSLISTRHAQAPQLPGLLAPPEKGFLLRYLFMDFLPKFRQPSPTIFTYKLWHLSSYIKKNESVDLLELEWPSANFLFVLLICEQRPGWNRWTRQSFSAGNRNSALGIVQAYTLNRYNVFWKRLYMSLRLFPISLHQCFTL